VRVKVVCCGSARNGAPEQETQELGKDALRFSVGTHTV
jgi:hypothetical protein